MKSGEEIRGKWGAGGLTAAVEVLFLDLVHKNSSMKSVEENCGKWGGAV
jgi:hypothetical protein